MIGFQKMFEILKTYRLPA